MPILGPCEPLCAPLAGGVGTLPLPGGFPGVCGLCAELSEAWETPISGGKRCGGRKQEKALALLLRLGGHFRPQCGRFPGAGLTLFRIAQTAIDAVSRKTGEYPRRCGIFADAATNLGGV